MYSIQKCLALLNSGFSLLTVGDGDGGKRPNFSWKKNETEPLQTNEFIKRYNYAGGLVKKDGKPIHPTINTGLITGFDFLEVIDVDLKFIKDPKEQNSIFNSYIKLVKKSWPDFEDKVVIAMTVNRGYHLLYKAKNCAPSTHLAKTIDEHPLFETRGIGGYVFMYENFLHKKNYLDIVYISDTERDILIDSAKTFNQLIKQSPEFEQKIEADTKPIKLTTKADFNNRNSVWSLIQNEFTIVDTHSDKIVIKRNGTENSSSGTIFKTSNVLYLFTTSTKYPSNEGLSAFKIYAIQKYAGDEKAAWKDLYNQGYGDRYIKINTLPAIAKPAPEPIELTSDYKIIDFPIEVYPAIFQTYVTELAEVSRLNIDYMGCALLWLTSICIGNSYEVKITNVWKEKAIVWIALGGVKGAGKSPALDSITYPLSEINITEINQFKRNEKEYKEFLSLSEKDKKNVIEIPEPVSKQFFVNNTTVEAIYTLHEKNKFGVGVLADELTMWINGMNQYKSGGADLAFWLQVFNGRNAIVNRKGSGASAIKNVFTPVIGNVPNTVFTRLMAGENMENGFFDRILFCSPDKKIEYMPESDVDQELSYAYKEFVIDLYRTFRNIANYDSTGEIIPYTANFTPEAKAVYHEIHNKFVDLENSDSETELVRGVLPKIKTYLPRIALILNCLNNYLTTNSMLEITVESVVNSEKVCLFFLENVRKFASKKIEFTDLKTILEANKNKKLSDKIRIVLETLPYCVDSELAAHLGVARQTIFRHRKKIQNETSDK
jgi:hypothetical protein